MAGVKTKAQSSSLIANNKRATYEYLIESRFEAGLVLLGWEIKSIRAGRAQLKESYITLRAGEAWLLGGHISPLQNVPEYLHPDPVRSRKLLLNRKEINKLIGAVQRKGYTVVPLRMYWKQQRVKLEIGLAKGKKLHDKRAAQKEKDWVREQARASKVDSL